MRARDPRPVIVFSDGTQSMGLAVDAIRDIIQHRLVVEAESETPGLLGTGVVDRSHHGADGHRLLPGPGALRRSWDRPWQGLPHAAGEGER